MRAITRHDGYPSGGGGSARDRRHRDQALRRAQRRAGPPDHHRGARAGPAGVGPCRAPAGSADRGGGGRRRRRLPRQPGGRWRWTRPGATRRCTPPPTSRSTSTTPASIPCSPRWCDAIPSSSRPCWSSPTALPSSALRAPSRRLAHRRGVTIIAGTDTLGAADTDTRLAQPAPGAGAAGDPGRPEPGGSTGERHPRCGRRARRRARPRHDRGREAGRYGGAAIRSAARYPQYPLDSTGHEARAGGPP